MEIILIKEVANLGDPGEILKVKNGYARNFLVPNGFAVKKSRESLRVLEKQKEEFAKIIAEKNAKYKVIIDKLKEINSIDIAVKTGEDGKLFGTVTSADIADAISEKHSLTIDKKQFVIREHIKMLGQYSVAINLSKDNKVELIVNVTRDAA